MQNKLWNPKIEQMDRKKTQELQLEKLKKQLVRVYEESPYYKEKFQKAKVDPYEFKSFEQYREYPFFVKDEERASQAESLEKLGHPLGMHITCDIREVIRYCASSGTTGRPSFQGHTRRDREFNNENYARMFTRMGVKPGDKMMHAGVLSMWAAGIPAVDGIMAFGGSLIPIGGLVGVIRVGEMASLTRPDMIMGTPSFMLHLQKKLRSEITIKPEDLGIRVVGVYGEPGGSVKEIYTAISEGFGGAPVYDVFGLTGMHVPGGVSCEKHNGIHWFADDNTYVEILDPDTLDPLPFEDGVEGEICNTGFDRDCGPLIRFREKDIVQVFTEPCSCGQPGWRLQVKGRSDDMLLVKGVNVFPNAIRDVIVASSEGITGNVRVVKPSPSPVIEPPVQVKVELKDGFPEAKQAELKAMLETEIQRRLRFKADVSLFAEGMLPVETGKTGKTKILEETYR